MDDVREFTVRFTLYWEGPVTTDGFTKVEWTCDTESRRRLRTQILASNGITNEQLSDTTAMVAASLIYNALNHE